MKQCTNCNFRSEMDSDHFCAICGAEMKTVSGDTHCKACGARLWPNARFCTKCGAEDSVFGPTLSAAAEPYPDVTISITTGNNTPLYSPPAPVLPPPSAENDHDAPAGITEPDSDLCETEETLPDGILTKKDIMMLGKRALKLIPERVAYYAPLVGVKYGRITIRNYKCKWGACSPGGDLDFNSFLMLVPPKVLDSVIVHELCHILQPNHSNSFYAEVLRVFPDYWKYNVWLDDHADILNRMGDDYVYTVYLKTPQTRSAEP